MSMIASTSDVTPAHEEPAAARVRFYRKITAETTEAARTDPFLAHVFACALTAAYFDAAGAGSFGLDAANASSLFDIWLPAARRFFVQSDFFGAPIDEEEEQLRGLLESFRVDASQESAWLASILARRSMQPRHLWQDLGLVDRSELHRLMHLCFPALASRNSGAMRWKKFFFRALCESEGFTLCAAPTCRECSDFNECFGDETGESQLARLRRDAAPSSH